MGILQNLTEAELQSQAEAGMKRLGIPPEKPIDPEKVKAMLVKLAKQGKMGEDQWKDFQHIHKMLGMALNSVQKGEVQVQKGEQEQPKKGSWYGDRGKQQGPKSHGWYGEQQYRTAKREIVTFIARSPKNVGRVNQLIASEFMRRKEQTKQ